jgi:hypothetical protein
MGYGLWVKGLGFLEVYDFWVLNVWSLKYMV